MVSFTVISGRRPWNSARNCGACWACAGFRNLYHSIVAGCAAAPPPASPPPAGPPHAASTPAAPAMAPPAATRPEPITAPRRVRPSALRAFLSSPTIMPPHAVGVAPAAFQHIADAAPVKALERAGGRPLPDAA